MNSKLKPDIRNEATNEIPHQYLSAAKARRVLGWKPLFTLEKGLDLTISWYKQFLTHER
jgi:CDP-glucose 4,6-dehydratase